jgi:hypothetical protein
MWHNPLKIYSFHPSSPFFFSQPYAPANTLPINTLIKLAKDIVIALFFMFILNAFSFSLLGHEKTRAIIMLSRSEWSHSCSPDQ